MDWKFSFWTPGSVPAREGRAFGCSSHGLAAHNVWCDPDLKTAMDWTTPLPGDVLAGSYAGRLDAPLIVATGTLVGFMFGELVTLDGRPQFGNLMAARLVPWEGNPRQVMPQSTHCQ